MNIEDLKVIMSGSFEREVLNFLLEKVSEGREYFSPREVGEKIGKLPQNVKRVFSKLEDIKIMERTTIPGVYNFKGGVK